MVDINEVLDEIEKEKVEKTDLIGNNECYCLQFSSLPDIFCKHCNGTGVIEHE